MDPSQQQQGSGAQPKSTSEAAPDIKNSTSPEVQAMRGPDTLAAAVQQDKAVPDDRTTTTYVDPPQKE
ncbi:hypothetical protein OEZ86_002928 [Tetradesmus obliquus]|uniref:Uncharacterized protein n=2 Tax=Tetradesmus obliquus TaxID=3088 RepID=A0A383VYF5_TETOB|nr:hypothetical protein OEZ85_012030 [Tetradesmus obliquus]WIA32077.1 hypothetical protein OEZ86_002928 [Tetradesmus obliquus]